MPLDVHKYKSFYKENWYIQKFNAAPNILDLGARSGIISCWRYLGYGYKMFINIYRNDFAEMFYHKKSLKLIHQQVVKHQRQDKKYLEKIRKLWLSQMDELSRKYLNRKFNFSNLAFTTLVKEYHKFYKLYIEACGIAHIIEGITLTTDIELKNLLLKELHKQKYAPRLGSALPILTAPIQDTFFNKEQRSLARLINYVRNDSKLNKIIQGSSKEKIIRVINRKPRFREMLDNHIKHFHWIRNSYAGAVNLKLWDFLREIREFIRLNKDLVVVPPSKPKNNYLAKKSFIKKWKLTKEIQELIYLTDFMTSWQDERKEYTLRGINANENFLSEIGRRIKIPLYLMRYLLINEFEVNNLKRVKKNNLRLRRKGCVVMASKKIFDTSTTSPNAWHLGIQNRNSKGLVAQCQPRAVTGNEIESRCPLDPHLSLKSSSPKQKIHQVIEDLPLESRGVDIVSGNLFRQIVKKLTRNHQMAKMRELSGLPGAAGKIVGKVKICFDLKDMRKIKEGDILVTSMTRPEYMPAIKIAAGIITDEGGITCHAAIISRELGKPCVIGTKVATKCLKDGDTVELNGNHGLVKVIFR